MTSIQTNNIDTKKTTTKDLILAPIVLLFVAILLSMLIFPSGSESHKLSSSVLLSLFMTPVLLASFTKKMTSFKFKFYYLFMGLIGLTPLLSIYI